MFDSNPPSYTAPIYHPQFCFSNNTVTFQVENTRFRGHDHFLFTYSSVFREKFGQRSRTSSSGNTSSNDEWSEDENIIYLDDVTVLEFESLLKFFYESWQDNFSMSIQRWVALLAIAHQFEFTQVESRARREVFQGIGSRELPPVIRIFLAEKLLIPISFIIPALEDLVRRTKPLKEREVVRLSSEMVARIGVAREKYVRESSRMFASEAWLKRVAHDIVKSVWCIKEAPSGA